MGGENPALIVRVVGDIESLKKDFAELKTQSDATAAAMAPLVVQTQAAGAEASKATPQVTTLKTAFNQFDGVLASLGVNIGSEIRGLGELGEAAGKTGTQIGAVATAGLVAGAAFAGWKVGRVIADFFSLDTAIGNVTAKLLGWGDVAAETAAAKADVLARASQRAGVEITDMALAVAINSRAIQDWRPAATIAAEVTARWQKEIEKVRAGGDLAQLTADLTSQNFTLEELAARYHLSEFAVKAFKNALDDAADAVVVANKKIDASNTAKLHALAEEIKLGTEARKLEAAALLATTKLWDEYYALRISHGGTSNQIAIAQIKQWEADTIAAAIKAGTATKGFYDALAADSKEKMAGVGVDWSVFSTISIPALQETARNARETYNQMFISGQFFREDLDAQLTKTQEAEAAARGMGKAYVDAFEASAAAARDLAAETKKAAAEAKAADEALRNAMSFKTEATFQNFDDLLKKSQGHWRAGTTRATEGSFIEGEGQSGKVMITGKGQVSAYQAATMGYGFGEISQALQGHPLGPNPAGPRIPGFAGGVQDYSGGWAMVGEKGPEAMYVPPHASIYPSGSGGGATITNHFYINGTIKDLTRPLMDELTKQLKQGRQWPSA